MIKVFNTYPKLTLAEIEEVENFVGLTFPYEYKAHLLQYNGGECEPNIFSFWENGRETNSDINWFLGIHPEEDENLMDFIQSYKIEQMRLPRHILPFAFDSFGNLICISCGGSDAGKIYFWDHEKEVDYMGSDDLNYSNLYLIANNFDEFLDGLQDESEIIGEDGEE